jgi:hypothetical protein
MRSTVRTAVIALVVLVGAVVVFNNPSWLTPAPKCSSEVVTNLVRRLLKEQFHIEQATISAIRTTSPGNCEARIAANGKESDVDYEFNVTDDGQQVAVGFTKSLGNVLASPT